MDPIDLADHSHNPQEQIGEEYYVVVDNQHRSPYNERKSTNHEEEYYTPMDAGMASMNPAVLPGNQPVGANSISPLGGANVGQELTDSTEPRDRSDTVIEYQNTTEWTAPRRYVNFTPAIKKEGDKQQNKAGASKQPAGISKKPPQTTPKPAKNEELPIYGNISTNGHTNRVTEEENNDSEASDAEEEYVVPYWPTYAYVAANKYILYVYIVVCINCPLSVWKTSFLFAALILLSHACKTVLYTRLIILLFLRAWSIIYI